MGLSPNTERRELPMGATGLTLHEVCNMEELWDGEMEVFDVGRTEVLVIKHEGRVHAYQAHCPHQDIPLVEGKLEKGVLTCRAHLWQFAVNTGRGVNPANCRLKRYPLEIKEGMVCVGDIPIDE
jgi:toluene monooxygenase system ferredoxin subunit